jgi:hypothetical protein
MTLPPHRHDGQFGFGLVQNQLKLSVATFSMVSTGMALMATHFLFAEQAPRPASPPAIHSGVSLCLLNLCRRI